MTLSPYATTIQTTDNLTRVTYHSTDIVAFNDSMIVLNSGGWKTVTTKRKMNQASVQFELGFSVFQDKGEWFVILPNRNTVDFVDGMTFSRDGKIQVVSKPDSAGMTTPEILDALTKIGDAGISLHVTLVAGLPYRIDWYRTDESQMHRDYPDDLRAYLTNFLASL